MVLRLEEATTIEDLRNHPPEVVEKLRAALAAGAVAHADPRRESLYEVESEGQVFYICIAPTAGKVLLVGTWLTGVPSPG